MTTQMPAPATELSLPGLEPSVLDAPADGPALDLPTLELPAAVRRTTRRALGSPRLARLLCLDVAAAAAGVVAVRQVDVLQPVPLSGLVPLVWVLLLAAAGGYAVTPGATALARGRGVLRAGTALGLACWLTTDLLPGSSADRDLGEHRAVLMTVLLVAGSFALRALPTSSRRTRVVVAGEPGAVNEVLRELRGPRGQSAYEPVGLCLHLDLDPVVDPSAAAPEEVGSDPAGTPVRRGLEHLVATVEDHAADAVIVVPGPWLDGRELRRIGWRLEGSGATLLLSAPLVDVVPARIDVTSAGGVGVLHLRPPRASGPGRLAKTVADRVLAALLLVLSSPLLLALAVVVRVGSTGPAVFRQTRVGRHGRQFTLYKFRTMTQDAELSITALADQNVGHGVLFKIQRDPRVTRAGAVLRRYSLDELPQLVNVLLGDMSLVGPRPALPGEVDRYDFDMRRRLVVRPGLTGLWQVSGRSDLSAHDAERLDLQYVENWSWRLDVAIALRTVRAVLGHHGAY